MIRKCGGLVAAVLLTATATIGAWAAPATAQSVRDQEWFLTYLHIARAHQISRGDGVVVAVMDTGVDTNHPDLTGNVLSGKNFVPGLAADPAVRTDADPDGHGTAMAGLIAGHGNGNGSADGLLGIAPGSKLLPIRTSRGNSGGDGESNNAEAMRWVASQRAGVLNASFVEPISHGGDRLALEELHRADVVVVAAVGNAPGSSRVGYPAAEPGVLAVGGVDTEGRHSAGTVTGPELVISAPSEQMISTARNGGYRTGDGGSSSATAIVSGAVALVRARFPQLNADQVIHRITATADDKGAPGRDPEYGFGVLNVVRALTATIPGEPPARAEAKPVEQARSGSGGRTGSVLVLLGGLLLVGAVAGGVWGWRRRA